MNYVQLYFDWKVVYKRFTIIFFRYRRKAKAIRPSGSSMVNARGSGGLSDQQQQQYPSPSHCNEDSLENGHGSRNGSMRSTSHCLQGNGRWLRVLFKDIRDL